MPPTTTLAIDVVLRDGEWANVITDPVRHAHIERVGLLPNGTRSGLPAFELLARTSDGGTVLLETTWATMRTALKTLDAGWPDGRQHVSEQQPSAPASTPEPSDFAVYTAGWLVGLAVRESPGGIDRIEKVEGAPASARIVTLTGKSLLVTVTEEAE